MINLRHFFVIYRNEMHAVKLQLTKVYTTKAEMKKLKSMVKLEKSVTDYKRRQNVG